MDKYIFDEKNGLWYELQGDYYLPRLELPKEEQQSIGIWGQRHRRYLKGSRRVLYADLLTSGQLNGYLADIDRKAEEMFSLLIAQMTEAEGITDKLKADDMMSWVCRMNSVRSRAEELVNAELIYL